MVDDRALIVGPAMERAAAMRVDLDPDALPCLCKLNEEVGKPPIINPVVGGRRRMRRVYDPTYDVALVCRPNPVHDALVPAATAVAYLPQRL